MCTGIAYETLFLKELNDNYLEVIIIAINEH